MYIKFGRFTELLYITRYELQKNINNFSNFSHWSNEKWIGVYARKDIS